MPVLAAVVILFLAAYLLWRKRYGYVPRERTPVLCFHKISDRFCWEGTWTPPDRFYAYVDHLRNLGYRFVSMDDYLHAASPGRVRGRSVLLTFDDGYRELYDVVLPGLESRGVTFHVFLVTDYVGRENEWELKLGRRAFRHLGWRQIEDMASRGVTFGSHGASHGDFTRMGAAQVREDLERSKRAIEEHLGSSVRTLSFPFGRYNDAVKEVARRAGFEAAFSLYPSHHNRHFDRYAIRRNGVYIIDPVRCIEAKWRPGPWFWLEEVKCRAINSVAVLTPLVKRPSPRGWEAGRSATGRRGPARDS